MLNNKHQMKENNTMTRLFWFLNLPPNILAHQSLLVYATWMAFCVPLMLLNTVMAWLAILLIMRLTLGPDTSGSSEKEQRIKKVILARKGALGRITMHEVQVVILFLALILLWFFQSPRFMPGWADAEVSIQKTWNCVCVIKYSFRYSPVSLRERLRLS